MKHTCVALVALLALTLVATACAAAAPPLRRPAAAKRDSVARALAPIEARYAQLLARHRPDLSKRYGATPYSVRFEPLDEASTPVHLRALRALLAECPPATAGAAADSLRARISREIEQTEPGGAIYHDAFLWLDVVEAAVMAPWVLGPASGCGRTQRGTLQLRTLPEALRGAAVLMRGRGFPDPVAFEARLTALELLLRHELPRRTEACKESRRLAEFAEADSLAAASIADFRRLISPGE